ncbi:MAG: MMPL family transporter [Natrialbaceae archaeon]|nr:MMPL family transporter [Natrialbaceae archaeon]
MRVLIDIEGDATADQATADTRELARAIDTPARPATATGQLVVFHVVERELLRTVLESLAVSFVVMVAFLMLVYRYRHDSAMLGAITLSPIALAVAWILGTMWLLEVPFNVLTGMITSLTVGLGVAYNIHIAERFRLERMRGATVDEALRTSTTGTGGALLGSAATTVGGFGVLIFAILPPLQQFGLITALTIIYAFLGSVFLLPSLLVIWSRYRP